MNIGDTVEVRLRTVEGWQVAKLTDVSVFGAGTWQDGVTVSTKHYQVLVNGKTYMVDSANIRMANPVHVAIEQVGQWAKDIVTRAQIDAEEGAELYAYRRVLELLRGLDK